MSRCCGGKNAGKPITYPRYLAGLAVFCGYHSVASVGLRIAARARPKLRPVRDFHDELFLEELGEILSRQDIRLGGIFRPPALDEACEIPLTEPAVAL